MRYESPIPRQPRLVKDDIELGGKDLRAGEVAFQMLNAANRDREFDDPETFDIGRTPNRRIGFGIGAHSCVGAPLSRLEGEVVFSKLISGSRTSTSSIRPRSGTDEAQLARARAARHRPLDAGHAPTG